MTLTFVEGLSYNNRIIETQLNTPQDFSDAGYTTLNPIYQIDFVPSDGVVASQIIDWSESLQKYFNGSAEPSYLIVHDDSADQYSHWWVTETVRTRKGQYKLTLLRDVIKDYYPTIKNSILFVERGTISGRHPLIFNSEGLSFNQIKKKETLLKDKTGCAWLVGYIDKDQTVTGTLPRLNSPYIKISASFESWYQNGQKVLAPFNTAELGIWAKRVVTPFSGEYFRAGMGYARAAEDKFPLNGVIYEQITSFDESNLRFKNTSLIREGIAFKPAEAVENAAAAIDPSDVLAAIEAVPVTGLISNFDLSYLRSLNNKYVEDANGKVCKVTISQTTQEQKTTVISGGALFNLLSEIAANSIDTTGFGLSEGTPNSDSFQVNTYHPAYIISLEEISDPVYGDFSYTIGTGRAPTVDAPYDVFCIPYGDLTIDIEDGNAFSVSKDLSFTLANSIIVNGAEAVYDMQLLPYCPVPELISGDGTITVPNSATYITIIQEEAGLPGTAVLYCSKSTFTFDIPVAENAGIIDFSNPLEVKIGNDCKKFRLCSPNYANYFDFSVAKNGGVNGFNVDCAYKPYTPYIHINPVFGNLYGADFNDVRGVILGGDFSLTMVKDAWASYQLNNKYYQQTFDRQIQNMDKMHDIEIKKAVWEGTIGAINQGVQTGMMTGMMGGGGIASGVGGLLAGGSAAILSAVGAGADIEYAERAYAEQKDFTIDMHNYSLQTVQALPQTISKVSAYNPNNKIFPLLEEYDCTEEEKQIYIKNLCYSGFTIRAIGTIEDYASQTYTLNNQTTQKYIKARLVRLDNTSAVDSHMVNAISRELDRGVYIK